MTQVLLLGGGTLSLIEGGSSAGGCYEEIVVRGRVSSGLGEGKFFTELPWVKAQFIAKLGIDPFPGTFNLTLEDPEDQKRVASLRSKAGLEIVPDSPEFCSGKCFNVIIEGVVAGAVVFPEVDDYPIDKMEIISPVSVKNVLKVEDGDTVTLTVFSEPSRPG